MQQLSQELGGELGHPAGEEGHRKELVGTQTRFQGSRQVSNIFLHPSLDILLKMWKLVQQTLMLQSWAIQNLFSLLNTCARLGLIGYQEKTEEMLRPSLSTGSTQVGPCFAKTFNSRPKLVLYLCAKGSGINGHEINCVMCSHGTGDQFDVQKKCICINLFPSPASDYFNALV